MDPYFDPVLVTGASGFVGGCTVRRLLQQGYEVHALLRPGTRTWRLEGIMDRICVHWADLLDEAAVRSAIDRARPAAIVHLAAFGAYESQTDARRILSTNVLGSLAVLETGLEAGVRVFVNAGSSSEYGYRADPMHEGDRLEPNSVYAVAKAAQTHLCRLMAGTSDTAIVTFRLFSVYGPWEEPGRLFPMLIRRARARLPLDMASPAIAHDFVYVDDVLDATLAFDKLAAVRGEVLNLGTGIQSTLQDVVAAVLEVVGSGSEVRWRAMPPRRWDTDTWVADPSRARAMLGWAPRHTLRDGIARMAEWMSAHSDYYGRL